MKRKTKSDGDPNTTLFFLWANIKTGKYVYLNGRYL